MRQHHTPSQPDEPCVVFRDVAARRGGHIIWRDGNFSIPMGSVTAIVGTNGTGKTTMMQAELGLLPLEHGSIRVLGRPAGDANHLIGYVPQSYTSDIESNLTAEQSVLLGLTGSAMTLQIFLAGALLNAIPGIIVQLILIPVVMLAMNRTGLVPFKQTNPKAKNA